MWLVKFGVSDSKISYLFYTQYHAEQFVRALRLNGTPCTLESYEPPDPKL